MPSWAGNSNATPNPKRNGITGSAIRVKSVGGQKKVRRTAKRKTRLSLDQLGRIDQI